MAKICVSNEKGTSLTHQRLANGEIGIEYNLNEKSAAKS